MNTNQRLWVIIATGIVITLIVGLLAFRILFVCCAPAPATTQTASALETLIVLTNDYSQPQHLLETQTAAYDIALALSVTPTPTLPYDATLYAQRRLEELGLETGAGPTQYAIFFATETALVATYQGTILPSATPIPYTADMSPTAIPLPSHTFTPSPTLCPPSDVICPGGNMTQSPAQQVFVLMASAEGTEFRQLALTATALATRPTPTPTANYPQCIWTWARKDLPDVTGAAQSALTETGLKNVTVRSEAYGENCVDSRNNQIAHFAAMTTDFYLQATVTELDDSSELASIVKTAYATLSTLKVKLPAMPGYLDIVFADGDQTKHFRAMFAPIKRLIDGGKDDAALLAAGGL